MTEFLTARQLQEILRVDRTTIYRMAESGRLPGLKVGNQWRFPRQQIEAWLQSQSGAMPAVGAGLRENGDTAGKALDVRQAFPLECVQLIQDSFADMLSVMVLVTDLDGQPITRPSNPCGLYTATETAPHSHQRCLQQWAKMAQEPGLAPRFQASPLGLLCARGLIRIGADIRAMLVVGGIAPETWPPAPIEVQRMAADLGLDAGEFTDHVGEVHRLDPEEQARVLSYVQRIADIFAHIASERLTLFDKLQRIAEITQT